MLPPVKNHNEQQKRRGTKEMDDKNCFPRNNVNPEIEKNDDEEESGDAVIELDNLSDESLSPEDISDSEMGKDEQNSENAELVTSSLFFDSVPKRKCKRKGSRMKRDILKKAATACSSSNKQLKIADSSTIIIKAIHIHPNQLSISSTSASENSFAKNGLNQNVEEINRTRPKSPSNVTQAFDAAATLNELSKSLVEYSRNETAIEAKFRTETTKQHDDREFIKNLSSCNTNNQFFTSSSSGDTRCSGEDFVASLPGQFKPFLGENPALFELIPLTLERALDFASHARFITEANYPFRIIHTNASFGKLGKKTNCPILGKPLATLKTSPFFKDFLDTLDNETINKKSGIKAENKTLPNCFIRLILVGKDISPASIDYSANLPAQVTHFLVQIETSSSASSMKYEIPSGVIRKSGLHASAIG